MSSTNLETHGSMDNSTDSTPIDINENESQPVTGDNSSNSTVEESSKRASCGSVRPYVRSKTPRLRWTPELRLCFLHAVERLGGQERATPKLVLQMMKVKGLSIAHVKSHLQMFRSKKIDDPNQVISDQRLLLDAGDRHVYNLSQLPMLQNTNFTPISSLSYSDAARGRNTNAIYSPFSLGASNISRSSGLFGSSTFENKNDSLLDSNHTRQSSLKFLDGDHRMYNSRFWQTRFATSSTNQSTLKFEDRNVETPFLLSNSRALLPIETKGQPNEGISATLKRKVNLDLNLSLETSQERERKITKLSLLKDGNYDVDSNLSLSLFSSSSKEIEHGAKKKTNIESTTLDLTL